MQVNVVGHEVVTLCQPVTLPVSTVYSPRRLKYSATLLWSSDFALQCLFKLWVLLCGYWIM